MTQGDRTSPDGSGTNRDPSPAPGEERDRHNGGAAPDGPGASNLPAEAAPSGAAPWRVAAEGNMIGRPRSLAAPPPDPAEALYYEGMAAYQHRNWEQALDRFSRLKELQPTRPGLDALLDEVRWFLQLQAAVPGGPNAAELPAHGRPPAAPRTSLRLNRWQSLGIVLLAVIGITALVLIAFQGRLPWATASQREAQELYNRGQSRLSVGDYEGAQEAYRKVLAITPGDPEAQMGLARAQRLQALAQEYAAAEAAIAEEDWDNAKAQLDKVLAGDPGYADAQAKADFVAQRQRLAGLYADGSRLYDLGQWQEASAQFEKIRELNASYRAEAVAEFLFVSYLNAGQALIDEGKADVPTAERAVDLFSRAVAIHPRNRMASDARRQSGLYLDALRALANDNQASAQTQLAVLLAEAPAYARNKAVDLLYTSLLRSAEIALQAGDIPTAIKYYRQAQTVPVPDQSAAVQGEKLARSITPTPIPTATATPGPTPAPPPLALVRDGPLNLRAGPGVNYQVVAQIPAGATVTVLGRTAAGSWLKVCLNPNGNDKTCASPGAGSLGWLESKRVEALGSLDGVAVAPTPPAPTPLAPLRPTATRPPQVVCLEGSVHDTAGGGPLQGWLLTLQGPAGALQTTRTDSTGAYRFDGMAAGAFTISLQMEPEWRAVSPQESSVTVTPASACAKVDFWAERGTGGSAARPTSPPPPSPPPTPPR